MMSRISLSAIVALLFSMAVFSQVDSFQINGAMRNYIYYVPSGLTNMPLVINMHGLNSNASQQRLYTQFDKIAAQENSIVVYPNAINSSWDLVGNTDVTFITALIDTMYARYRINRDRVYATGLSMGGFMSHRLGCVAADRITAIASVAGLDLAMNPTPARPVPVMQIHGTADNVVQYSGVAATISAWVNRNGCPQTPQITSPYPPSNPNSKVRKEYYGICNKNSEVVLLAVEGGGHVWPGGLGSTADINASEEIWAFLKNHSLSSAIADKSSGKNSGTGISAFWNADKICLVTAQEIRSVNVLNPQGRLIAQWKANTWCGPISIRVDRNAARGVYLLAITPKAHGAVRYVKIVRNF